MDTGVVIVCSTSLISNISLIIAYKIDRAVEPCGMQGAVAGIVYMFG